jgi:hypothetical protein
MHGQYEEISGIKEKKSTTAFSKSHSAHNKKFRAQPDNRDLLRERLYFNPQTHNNT